MPAQAAAAEPAAGKVRAARKPRKSYAGISAAEKPARKKRPPGKEAAKKPAVKKTALKKPARRKPAVRKSAGGKPAGHKPFPALRVLKFFKYAALYLLLVPFLFFYLGRLKKALLTTDRADYLRYGYVNIEAAAPNPYTRDRWQTAPLYAGVFHNDAQVTSIGGLRDVPLRYDPVTRTWKGRFPIPWNPPRGRYSLRLLNAGLEPGDEPVREFTISKRVLPPLKKGFSAVTLEYSGRYAGLTMKSPSGEKKPAAESLAEWAVSLKADALWVLVGKTTGTKGRIWDTVDFEAIRNIGAQCHKRGVKFGVWEMSYLAFPDKDWLPYKWAYDLVDGKVTRVRSISLLDPNRPDDIADLLSKFRDMPEVDFLGLDYIRNALGGYEMCEEFYRDMWWIAKPAGWDRMNRDQRIEAFARKKITRADRNLIEAWEWWRAERVAQIVHHIKTRLGDSKLLWAYTLGWNKGWQHGQDPAMIVDAGADIDAVMLYEADDGQYATMMRDWSGYLEKGDTRLVVGDIVDAPLHQKRGSREFARRLNWAGDGIYGPKGNAEGLFIHDLGRLLYGRKGNETTQDWVSAARDAVVRHKKLYGGASAAAGTGNP
ncbi:MAG: hypothetical protein PHW69_00455 [Elusimicrobiaceae bacterium]|nr:hypothetical protein [Elusimicrobiaceae bacterium]